MGGSFCPLIKDSCKEKECKFFFTRHGEEAYECAILYMGYAAYDLISEGIEDASAGPIATMLYHLNNIEFKVRNLDK